MIQEYSSPKKAKIKDYLACGENAGKVALFNVDIPGIVAEGEKLDWVELELLYEKLREQGNYELVIVRSHEPSVTRFESIAI